MLHVNTHYPPALASGPGLTKLWMRHTALFLMCKWDSHFSTACFMSLQCFHLAHRRSQTGCCASIGSSSAKPENRFLCTIYTHWFTANSSFGVGQWEGKWEATNPAN